MRRYRIAEPAKRDLDEIWAYIARDNPSAAHKLISLIHTKLTLLADSPGIGSIRRRLSPGLRRYCVGHYGLFYHEIPDGIELIRVLHGARKIRRRMFTGDDAK